MNPELHLEINMSVNEALLQLSGRLITDNISVESDTPFHTQDIRINGFRSVAKHFIHDGGYNAAVSAFEATAEIDNVKVIRHLFPHPLKFRIKVLGKRGIIFKNEDGAVSLGDHLFPEIRVRQGTAFHCICAELVAELAEGGIRADSGAEDGRIAFVADSVGPKLAIDALQALLVFVKIDHIDFINNTICKGMCGHFRSNELRPL